MVDKPIHLKVVTRGELVYEGDVISMSSVNDKGKFDVLIRHANFITLIRDEIIIRDTGGEERVIKIGRGILKVFENEANAYLGVK
jgi:F0F1-type ATP synthase epsilon subunit